MMNQFKIIDLGNAQYYVGVELLQTDEGFTFTKEDTKKNFLSVLA
jgi:hypothetical protein